jgi:hypothetical protein
MICSSLRHFQICVLLDITDLLTRHFVNIVRGTPLVLRVQVPVHLVQLEQLQLIMELNVVCVIEEKNAYLNLKFCIFTSLIRTLSHYKFNKKLLRINTQ